MIHENLVLEVIYGFPVSKFHTSNYNYLHVLSLFFYNYLHNKVRPPINFRIHIAKEGLISQQ